MISMPTRPTVSSVSSSHDGRGGLPNTSLSRFGGFFGPRDSFAGLFSSSPAPAGISRDTAALLQVSQAVSAPLACAPGASF